MFRGVQPVGISCDVVAGTTNVNTGKKIGVVVRLQQMFKEKGHPNPSSSVASTMC